MSILSRSDTDFFLTGGTALSRAYYNHRYSDDLDFFLNQSQTYDEQLDKVFALFRENGFVWSIEKEFTRAPNFTTLMVRRDSDVFLKLDFVNDMVPHYGEIALHETIDWSTIIQEARQKEAGLELNYITEILTSIPQSEFETIAWTKKPDWQEFRNDIERIVYEMMSGEVL